jgi:uncharacterized protein (TIGR03089 family)
MVPTTTDVPLLTYIDDATGEYVALSSAELGSWAARTASLLRDGCGLAPGARVAVLAAPHWQTAAILLGAWSIGLAVSFRSNLLAGVSPAPGEDGEYDAVFVDGSRIGSWIEDVPEGRHRFVLNGQTDGFTGYAEAVRAYPDETPDYHAVRANDAASVDGTSYGEWMALAHAMADRWGLGPGDRLLVDVAQHQEPLKWLLAPLAVGATVVLCANSDPATLHMRRTSEGITHEL